MHIYTNAFSLTSKWLNHFRMRMKILHEFCSLSKFLEKIFRLIGTQVEKEDSCQPVVFVRWIFLMGYVRMCPYLILFNVRAISGEPPLPTRGPGLKCWTASIWQWDSEWTTCLLQTLTLQLTVWSDHNSHCKAEKGQIYGLLGASGCGKTSLLSVVVGRRQLNSGLVQVMHL